MWLHGLIAEYGDHILPVDNDVALNLASWKPKRSPPDIVQVRPTRSLQGRQAFTVVTVGSVRARSCRSVCSSFRGPSYDRPLVEMYWRDNPRDIHGFDYLSPPILSGLRMFNP